MVQLWNLSLQDVADPLRKAGSKLLHEHFVFWPLNLPMSLPALWCPLKYFKVRLIKLGGCSRSEEFDVI